MCCPGFNDTSGVNDTMPYCERKCLANIQQTKCTKLWPIISIALCQPVCINGECAGPGNCTCDNGFVGETCRDG